MTALVALLLAAASPQAAAPAPPPAARFEETNRAYLSGEFEAAARGYQELLDEGWESASLHVNLGNARFRMGKRGLAAASYSRALRLDPGDADARANLDLVRAQNVDQVVGAEARPLAVRAVDRVPDRFAVGAFALAWLCLWSALVARRFAARARRTLGELAVAAALCTVLAGGLLAGKAAARGATTAVIVVAAAPVREAPDPALRPAFELHEGTEVRVLELRAGAARVRLGNGLEGWVSVGDLEAV